MHNFFRNDLTKEPIDKNIFEDKYPELYKYFNKLYNKNKDYLDGYFLNSAYKNDFLARYWELELVNFLRTKKFNVKKHPGQGHPDFRIELDNGKKVWIEAVTYSDISPCEFKLSLLLPLNIDQSPNINCCKHDKDIDQIRETGLTPKLISWKMI
ncbi:hypothetical protein GKC56_01660 [Neisseriaceae bacterium PsAf]|nr:hypothetical protein [Neisseriaceae bacterium PsAf]